VTADDVARAAIAAERKRQVEVEGYTPEGDAGRGHELVQAARAYLTGNPDEWPWALRYFKRRNRLRNLTRAGALALAARDAGADDCGAYDKALAELAGIISDVPLLEPVCPRPAAPCPECRPGYRVGDDGCRHGAAAPGVSVERLIELQRYEFDSGWDELVPSEGRTVGAIVTGVITDTLRDIGVAVTDGGEQA